MQTVTLDVLDLLPCLIWEPLVESHSNKTRVWKRRGHLGETMLRAALHIFTVNEWMLRVLWRRNKGCLRQELCVFVVYLNPVGKKPCVWTMARGDRTGCSSAVGSSHGLLWSAVSTPGGKGSLPFCKGTCSCGLGGRFYLFFFKYPLPLVGTPSS